MFQYVWDLLVEMDSPKRSDLIFVLAGRPERKVYGLRLFREGLAPRIILSVGRFEVRKIGALGFKDLELRERSALLPPEQRHFFIDLISNSPRVIVRGDAGEGTYAELRSLGRYLEFESVRSLLLISTSIHLRRVKYCCRRCPLLCGKEIRCLPVPEDLSVFRCTGWWKRRNHWAYVLGEYAKLGIEVFRMPRETR